MSSTKNFEMVSELPRRWTANSAQMKRTCTGPGPVVKSLAYLRVMLALRILGQQSESFHLIRWDCKVRSRRTRATSRPEGLTARSSLSALRNARGAKLRSAALKEKKKKAFDSGWKTTLQALQLPITTVATCTRPIITAQTLTCHATSRALSHSTVAEQSLPNQQPGRQAVNPDRRRMRILVALCAHPCYILAALPRETLEACMTKDPVLVTLLHMEPHTTGLA
ncbi:unnamed protein product [Polarella glacialis]|uniref:Uncharacterized protein n=1 Tax=Polarella glacialis TaxID=89957 RepID=A0A813LT74_POLGL|nr:unnamed protein product [Polarella glacialis]